MSFFRYLEISPKYARARRRALRVLSVFLLVVGFSLVRNGSAFAQSASFSTASLTFASQAIGNPSAPQTITLSNTGGGTLSISSIAITGISINDFAQTNNCGSSLAAGSSCTISVTFTPTASGTRYGGVTVTDNAAGSPQTVSLTGTGATVAGASISPGSIAFASQAIGNPTAAQTVTLWNPGSAALSISSIAITGISINDFKQTNTCGSSLAAGSTCIISVTFTPTATGARYGGVTITDNAAGSPQTVTLTGTGATVPGATFSAGSLTFASQAIGNPTAAQTLTLWNPGSAALSISSIAITGISINDFAQTNNCGSSLAAGSTCTISVTFTPTASGARYGGVTVTDNAAGSPQTVSFTGTGATVAGAVLSPTSVNFGSEAVGSTSASQTVTLTNNGSAALSISSIAFTGANAGDYSQADTCGSSVAAGSSCTIAILWKPSVSGTSTASLTVTDNAGGSPQSASLSGSATGTSSSTYVTLAWTASTTSGVTGYNVYRGTTSGGESQTPVNSSPVTSTTFEDTSVVAGQTYYYVVTAIASGGMQSSDSNEASATVP